MSIHRSFALTILMALVVALPMGDMPGAEEKKRSVFFHEGKELMDEEKYGDALTEFKKVLQRDPDDEQTHFLIAVCYENLNRANDAIDSFKEVVRINPLNVDARMRLGKILRSRVRFNEAAEQFKAVTTLTSDLVEPWEVLGSLHREMGNRGEAIDAFRKLLELDEDHAEAHFQYGALLYQQYTLPDSQRLAEFRGMAGGEIMVEVMNHFQKAMEADPTNPESYAWVASLYSSQGRFDEALQTVNKGLQNKDSVQLRLKLAEIHFNMDQLDQANAQLQRVFSQEKENAEGLELRDRIEARREQINAGE